MSWLSNLFHGNKNPADAANNYYNQIPGQTQQYYQPHIDAGRNSLQHLQDQYSGLLNNPGGKLNEIGSSFQKSPGFDFALQQALQGGNHAAAAGGMAGSPQHEQQNMQLATQLGNQDYNNYLGHATGLYNQGLQGEQGLNQQGLGASNNMAEMIAHMLAQQGQNAYTGQQDQNMGNSSIWHNLFKGAGALSAFTPWGQAGGALDNAFNRFYGGG